MLPGDPAAPRAAHPTTFDVLRWLQESAATVTDGAGTMPVPVVCDQAAGSPGRWPNTGSAPIRGSACAQTAVSGC